MQNFISYCNLHLLSTLYYHIHIIFYDKGITLLGLYNNLLTSGSAVSFLFYYIGRCFLSLGA